MRKTRTKLPKMLEKRVFQEAASKCGFCPETEVACLEIHHIDEDPSNNTIENLLLVCASCHAKITGRVISGEAVTLKKRELKENLNPDSPKLKINAVLEMRNTDKREIVLVIPVVNIGKRPVSVSRVAVILEPRETSVIGNSLIKFTPASSELTAYQKNVTVKIEPDGDRHVWQIPFSRPADFKAVEKDGERYGCVRVELTSGDSVEREFFITA